MVELMIHYNTGIEAKYTVNKYCIEGDAIKLDNINIPEDKSGVPMGCTFIIPMHSVNFIVVKPYSRTSNIL